MDGKKTIRLWVLMLFWIVMGMGIGSMIWLTRILFTLQNGGRYIAYEPNSLILSFEIIGFLLGILISTFILFKVSKLMLRKIVYG
jgi:hypothetical protein